jgi:hypothetical protein
MKRSRADPLERECRTVIKEQVRWWLWANYTPAEAAEALSYPRADHLTWDDVKRKMRVTWLEVNMICAAPMASPDTPPRASY